MAAVDDIGYHSKRAMVELELAARAVHPDAARAHHRLATLHLERMQALSPTAIVAAARTAA